MGRSRESSQGSWKSCTCQTSTSQKSTHRKQSPWKPLWGLLASDHRLWNSRSHLVSGESNASRAYQYRDMFPLLINNWRQEWQQGDFPFYWVSLADYRREKPEPADSDWAELREAQTMTLSLPNTGEAIITDLGEADDIHPRNKQDVAKRLARLALAQDYGLKIVSRSPRYLSSQVEGNKMIIKFQDVGTALDTRCSRTDRLHHCRGRSQVCECGSENSFQRHHRSLQPRG